MLSSVTRHEQQSTIASMFFPDKNVYISLFTFDYYIYSVRTKLIESNICSSVTSSKAKTNQINNSEWKSNEKSFTLYFYLDEIDFECDAPFLCGPRCHYSEPKKQNICLFYIYCTVKITGRQMVNYVFLSMFHCGR